MSFTAVKRIFTYCVTLMCILCLAAPARAQTPTLTDGLVGYYPFNGNANDESGNGNDGTVNGATLAADRFGNANSAYSFDGTDDCIHVEDSDYLDITNVITLSAWFYTAAESTEPFILTKGGDTYCNYELRIPTSDAIFGFGRHNYWTTWSTEIIVETQKWYHLVALYRSGDLSSIKAYLNDTEIPVVLRVNTYGTSLLANDLTLYIGYKFRQDQNRGVSYFNGILDDIRIYNRVLSETEIDSLYHEGGWLAVANGAGLPAEFALHPPYPNPFNPSTTLSFDLPEATEITLVVYDIMGREVTRLVERPMEAGYHSLVWNGRDSQSREVPTGLYIARMLAPGYTHSIKLVLLK